MKLNIFKLLAAIILLFSAGLAWAAVEYHDFATPEQAQAYQSLISELRCLVCQNQTIADSNADLAKDLRNQVYQMLSQGQSKQQVVDFMTERYGDFVLYNPSFKLKTALLWLGPAAFLITGLCAAFHYARQTRRGAEATLSEARRQELQQLLEQDGE